jgi:hypothetical protein
VLCIHVCVNYGAGVLSTGTSSGDGPTDLQCFRQYLTYADSAADGEADRLQGDHRLL